MVVVVDDFDSGFVDFGCGGGMIFDFFFSFCGFDGCGGGDGGCCGYGLVVRCLIFFFLWVWWLWWWRWWLLWLWFGGMVFDFFFSLWIWLCLLVVVVVVVPVVVVVTDGRGGCGWR